MIAISFTNLVFLSYCLYSVAEQKQKVIQNKWFWMSVIGFMISAYITYVMLCPEVAINEA